MFNYIDPNCEACVYEYRLYNGDKSKMIRNWSLHYVSRSGLGQGLCSCKHAHFGEVFRVGVFVLQPPLDYKEWLGGGLYWIEVRHGTAHQLRCID